MYHLQTLGTLALRRGGPDGPALLENSKSLALVAYLAGRPGHRATRDHLADLFWPDADRSRARQSLRQALYYLQKKVGDRLVRSGGDKIVLRDELVEVDLWEMERALEAGEYGRVVELYGGRFLAPLQNRLGRQLETWVEARNEHVWTGLQSALHHLVQEALDGDRVEDAVEYAERYVRLNPLAESARRILIRTLVEAGRPLEALRSYESYRTLLAQELDDRPGPELERLVEGIRDSVFPLPEVRPDGAGPKPGPVPVDGGPPEAGPGSNDERPPPERDPEDWRPVAAAAVVLLAVGVVADGPLPALRAAGSASAGPAAVAVTSEDGPNLEIPVRAGPLSPASLDAGSARIPDPAGRLVAVTHRGPRGHDLAVEEVASKRRRILTRKPHDESPATWSPDGRFLVYRNGWLGDDGVHYHRRLRVLDLVAGADRRLADVPVDSYATVSWAPSGAWIAFDGRSREGQLDIWTLRPDGSDLRRLTTGPQDDAAPDWSPDGTWIAYASGPAGARDVFLKRIDDGRVIPLVDTGFDDHDPVWRSESRILFLSTRAGRTDVWEYDLDEDRRRRITSSGRVVHLRADPRRDGGRLGRWIDSLGVEPALETISPGQWLDLGARGVGSDGGQAPVPEGAVVWSTPTPEVLEQVQGSRFRVRGPGSATVVARMPGWRADTLQVPSHPVRLRRRATLLREDWTGGIDPERWSALGEPTPVVVRGDDRFGTTVDPAGDAHFQSGLVSRRSFPVHRGLTVEAWGRIRLTDRHYQQLGIGFDPEPARPPTPGWGGSRPSLKFSISGSPRGVRTHVTGSGNPFPPPDSLGSWRRYALQLHPDGRRSVAVDGRILWVEPASTLDRIPERVHAVVEGRSVGTDILVGPLRIYEGVRYVVW